jgi:ABC-2 type transport system ATP-binding protein
MITVENISKRFGRINALDNVSFKVNNGEIVGYVGLNGAGKTTTIRISVGVLYPDSGDVFVDGYSVRREKRKASLHIGWVPELPIFETGVKALDYFKYLAGYYGYSMGEAKKLGKKLLSEVGLENAINRKLDEYSQGMKKRFALAVSMINDPDNFLFDEVLNGLDPQGIAFFRNLALRFKKEGKAVLFSSHILSEVEQLADRVVFIHHCRIVGVYTMSEVKNMAEPAIRVKTDRVDAQLEKLLSQYGRVRIRPDGVYIIGKGIDSSEIVSILVKHGYKVKEATEVKASLEEAFFKIIGEEK